jgi:hypothetical protein
MAVVMTIPDLILQDTLNKCLVEVRRDYNAILAAGGDLTTSMLYILFDALQLERYGMFDNAVQLIITTPESPKHLFCKLSYDMNSSVYPSVHITMPAESDSRNVIGIGEGNQDEIIIDNGESEDVGRFQYRRQFIRRFNTSYQIVVMSDNKNEVILLYHLFKALIIAAYEHLELSGLNNIRMSGGDVSYSPRVPDRTFVRHIALNFDYETASTEFYLTNVIDQVTFVLRLYRDDGESISS